MMLDIMFWVIFAGAVAGLLASLCALMEDYDDDDKA